MQPKKIIFLMPSIKIGGGNRALISLIKKFNKEGYESTLYYTESSDRTFQLPSGIKLISTKLTKNNLLGKLKAFIALIKSLKNEKENTLLIVSDPILCIFKFYYSHLKVIRFVQGDDKNLFSENAYGNPIYNLAYKFLFSLSRLYKYEHIFFNSKFSRSVFFSSFNKQQLENFEIIHPPVFKHNIYLQEKEPELKFINVSNSHPRKGLDLFIKIATSSYFSDCSFTVISQDKLSLPDNISQISPKSDHEYFNELHKNSFFISTSSFEGFGLPPLEAMSLGLVLLALPNEGILTYCDENNAIFFKQDNLSNLRDEINLMFYNNKYSHYSQNSMKTSINYSEDAFQDNFFRLATNFEH